ncbi:MAG: hypothetical protein KHX99_01020 [Atopobium sp.]|nr:hypothetical protein [Atopobium sp.]
MAANVQLQDVCLALDIVQQKTIQVKVERAISFSSQKFDEKSGRVAKQLRTTQPRASSRMHASRKIRYLQADTGLNVLGTSKRKA